MPIDDKLGELEERKKEEVQDNEKNKTPNKLVEDARALTGPILVKYFQGELPGQQGKLDIDDFCAEFVKKAGFDVLKIEPYRHSSRLASYAEFMDNLDGNKVKEIIQMLWGDYALDADMVTLNQKNWKELRGLMPDFAKFEAGLNLGSKNSVNIKRATIHPQIVVMGMNLKYRPLAALTIERAIKNTHITLPTTMPTYRDELSVFSIKMSPAAQDYFEVAKQYGVKEAIPAMKEFKKVCDLYLEKWFK